MSEPDNSGRLPDAPLPGVGMTNIIGTMGDDVANNVGRKEIAKLKKAIGLIKKYSR